MSKIEITVDGKLMVQIEIRDHPFAKKWLEHWQFINSSFPSSIVTYQYPINYHNLLEQPKGLPFEVVKDAIDNIKDAATYLNSITNTHVFPYDLESFPSYEVFAKNDLVAQQHLNKIHRYFTNGVKTPSSDDLLERGMIKDKKDESSWLARIQEINQAVHRLDHHTKTPNVYNATLLTRLEVQYNLYNKDMYLSEGLHCNISQEECLDAADDNNNWDVWVRATDLLGKDYMTAFFQHDDPSEWDVQYLNTYTGMFVVYQDKTPVDYCKSKEFSNWLNDHNIAYDARMCGIPIGKTTFKNSNLQPKFSYYTRSATPNSRSTMPKKIEVIQVT